MIGLVWARTRAMNRPGSSSCSATKQNAQGLDQVFFTMCGSTAVDTALKIALAYHK
jgi:adenosylmethionine-8-amino-7-oxononanoate aminotransferase